MDSLILFLQDHTDFLRKLLFSMAIMLFILYATKLLRKWVIRFGKGAHGRYQVGKAISYASLIFTLLIVLFIWSDMLGSFSSFLGIIAAGVAVALKDPLTSLAGWVYLMTNRLYSLGDRIEIGKVKGDVVDIGTMRTTLIEIENWVDAEQNTGRVVHIPNNKLFGEELYNYTRASNFIWTEISVIITFESNFHKAQDLMTELINDFGEKYSKEAEAEIIDDSTSYLIKPGKLTPITYLRIVGSGVKLSSRFLVPVRKRRNLENEFQRRILDEFSKHRDINLAYDTYRIVR